MLHDLRIAERLMAHARLYQHMAEQTWSEDLAAKFRQKAADCVEAALRCAAVPLDGDPRKP